MTGAAEVVSDLRLTAGAANSIFLRSLAGLLTTAFGATVSPDFSESVSGSLESDSSRGARGRTGPSRRGPKLRGPLSREPPGRPRPSRGGPPNDGRPPVGRPPLGRRSPKLPPLGEDGRGRSPNAGALLGVRFGIVDAALSPDFFLSVIGPSDPSAGRLLGALGRDPNDGRAEGPRRSDGGPERRGPVEGPRRSPNDDGLRSRSPLGREGGALRRSPLAEDDDRLTSDAEADLRTGAPDDGRFAPPGDDFLIGIIVVPRLVWCLIPSLRHRVRCQKSHFHLVRSRQLRLPRSSYRRRSRLSALQQEVRPS